MPLSGHHQRLADLVREIECYERDVAELRSNQELRPTVIVERRRERAAQIKVTIRQTLTALAAQVKQDAAHDHPPAPDVNWGARSYWAAEYRALLPTLESTDLLRLVESVARNGTPEQRHERFTRAEQAFRERRYARRLTQRMQLDRGGEAGGTACC